MPDIIPWDKLAHFGMFFVLSVVCYYDYFQLNDGNVRKGRWIFWGFVIPVLYGASIELLQKYVFTGRSADIVDFLSDMIGSIVASILSIYMLNRKQKAKKSLPLQQNLR
ncbi:MAG: VanZ family protein [Dysgonomonadaceae bacterium]|nr:VanZ family protein [Dysgonamonadaceae bacterium]